MPRGARVIVFNCDEGFAPSLRADLLSVDGLKIVAELDDATLLGSAIDEFSADAAIIHLDPVPQALLTVAGELAAARPDVALFAISRTTDAELILAAMRAGFREFLTKPLDRQQLMRAVEKVALTSEERGKQGKLITVIGSVGGAGASTIAINLAVELATMAPGKVALVDLDFRYGQVATMLDIQPSFTIADLCATGEQIDPQMIEKGLVKHDVGVHVLARPNHFSQADRITASQCTGVLTVLQDMYDLVVVDGPNRFDHSGGRAVLDMADLNLLVIQLVVTSIRNTHRMLEEMQAGGYNLDRVKLVCNRHGLESGRLELEHVEATLNRKVFAAIPDDWRTVSSAVNMGEPLAASGPRTRVRQAVRELAERICAPGDDQAKKQPARRSGGLFGKIFADS